WRHSRRVWGTYSHYRGIRVSRAKRPDPPSWIQSYCQPELAPGVITRLSVVCQAYDEYLRYDWTQQPEGPAAGARRLPAVRLDAAPRRTAVGHYLLAACANGHRRRRRVCRVSPQAPSL